MWICLAFLLAAMAFCAVCCGRYSNDLSSMFPKGWRSGRMYDSLRVAGMTEAIQLDFDCGGPGRAEELGEKLLAMQTKLAAVPGIAKVKFRMLDPEALNLAQIIQALPLTAEASVLDKADASKAVNAAAMALSMPGVPVAPLRLDPFGLGIASLMKLESIGSLGGFNGRLSGKGFIMDEDGRHTLMLLWAKEDERWDAKRIRRLFEEIRSICTKGLPGDVRLSIVSPLRHSMENEETVRRDVLHVSIASVIALLILFLLVYKRAYDALWIPLLPLGATVISVGLFAIFCREVSLFVLGIGGAIAGLAVDQGIHVYAACCGANGEDRLRGIFRPLLLSTLTSAVVFLSLLASGVKAYMQLGVFAALTLLLNLVLSYFVLPTLLSRREEKNGSPRAFSPGMNIATLICSLWVLVLMAGIFSLQFFRPQLALSKLDGSRQGTFQEEEEFQKRWRNADASIPALVCGRKDYEVYELCEALRERLAIPNKFTVHSGQIWPPRLWRMSNLDSWNTEKAKTKLEELEETLQKQLAAKHLPPSFFKPFFDGIRKGMADGIQAPPPHAYAALTEYYTRERDGKVAFLVFIPRYDGVSLEEQEDFIVRRCPSVTLVSPTAFQAAARHDMFPRLERVGLWLALALMLILAPAYRSLIKMFVVALPGVTAFLAFSLLTTACGIKSNLATIFSLSILTGLVLDYGIFALHNAKQEEGVCTVRSMVLSALTTVLAAGAMLFSRHPVMFHTGLVLSFGIGVTAVTALYCIPALLAILPQRLRKLLLLLPLLLLAGCVTLPDIDMHEAQAFEERFYAPRTQLYTMKTSFLWYDFTMLVVVKTTKDTMQAIGTTPTGMTLFNLKMENGVVTRQKFSDAVPRIAQEKLFSTLTQDIANVFTAEDYSRLTYGGSPLHITEKRMGRFPQRRWKAVYYGWQNATGTYQRITYRNYRNYSTLTFEPR